MGNRHGNQCHVMHSRSPGSLHKWKRAEGKMSLGGGGKKERRFWRVGLILDGCTDVKQLLSLKDTLCHLNILHQNGVC